MSACLATLKTPLAWSERLDLTLQPAAMGEELQSKEEQHAAQRTDFAMAVNAKKKDNKKAFDIEKDAVHNDFKRELLL